MKLSFQIAKRYLFSKKSTHAINIISIVSMLGMGLGSFALIVLLSVFNGFEHLVLDLQNSFYSDIEIKAVKGKTFLVNNDILSLLKTDEIASYSFILEENAYLKFEKSEMLATVKGVDANYYQTSQIQESIVMGKAELEENGINYAVLGSGIDYMLGTNVLEPTGTISINIPKKEKTAAIIASQLFNTGEVTPGGVFLIQSEFDNKYIIIPLALMRRITKTKNEISAIEIRAENENDIAKIISRLENTLGADFKITARYQQDESLYKAMRAERWAVFAILGLIMFIISFNIVGSLSMVSIEKKQDISILKAMGMRQSEIKKIFLLQGVMGSILGAFIGLLLGLLLLSLQIVFGIIDLPSGGFVIDSYPVHIKFIDVLLSFLMVVIISIIASYYPAKKAAEQAFSFVKE
ncbi:MAG: FtsX-like permease family protein [Chitinophagales bacterium]